MTPKFYVKAAMFFAVIALFTWVWQDRFDAGHDSATAEMLASVNIAVEADRKLTKEKQGKVNEAAQIQFNKQLSINTQLNVDLDKLRKRAKRKQQTDKSKSSCEGATGSDLSAEDAGFLVGEAARADTLRTALEGCYSYADTVVNQ